MITINVHPTLIAFISDEDYELVIQYKWYAMKRNNTTYAVTSFVESGKGRMVYMHRLILGLNDSNVLTDHEDGNGLNNQRDNIRKSSISQNNANRASSKNSKSKYLGVSYDKGKWKARIRKNKKQIHLGVFESEKLAAESYNSAAIKYHGEFARINVL